MRKSILNQEDAINLAEKAVGLKCKTIKDFDSYFLLLCEPKDYDKEKNGEFLEGAFTIDKKSKKIERYNPLIHSEKENDELYHHGVKGMKWGVRNDPERSSGRYPFRRRRSSNINKTLRSIGSGTVKAVTATGRVIKSVAKGTSNAYKQHKINKEARRQRRVEKIIRSGNAKKVSKNIKKLSSSELQEAMTRINMNRQLKGIYNPKSIQPKQDGIVKSSLKNAARNVLTNTATTMLSDIALGRNPITAYKGRMEANKQDTNIHNTQQAVRQMNLDKQLSLLRYDPGVRVRAVVNKSAQKKLRSISINHFDFDINELYHIAYALKNPVYIKNKES